MKNGTAIWLSCWLLILPALVLASNPRGLQAAEPVPFSIEELQRRTFLYFWELAVPENGLIPDRYPKKTFSSIAATGFGLTAYVVGVDRGFVSREAAALRTRDTLASLLRLPQSDQAENVSGYQGFFYHFLDMDTGHRFKQVELSTIDTTLLMAGVLSCQSYFDRDDSTEGQIRSLAENLYRRVNWQWAFRENGLVSMGWRPEQGFLKHDWRGYNEAMILYLMAIGSPTYPIPAQAWEQWTDTYEWDTFYGQEHLNFAPLFGHQYSHMYIDFRGIQDAYMRKQGIDYFENSRRATLSQRAYAMDNPGGFNGYAANCWGLTACDGPESAIRQYKGKTVHVGLYWARGASAQAQRDDGTIAPTAAGGSVPFAPEICLPALRHLWNTYPRLVGEYGFHDAINLTFGFDPQVASAWIDTDYIGIDQGPILIQIANHQNQLVWDLMKRNPHLLRGLRRAGFRGGWLDASSPSEARGRPSRAR